MELAAALDAVRAVEGTLEIFSDSTYVVNCFRDHWWEGWIRRGWMNSKKQPVANRDLWEPLVEAYRARPVTFRWVKGHGGNKWNDVADRLAVHASLTQRGVEGEGEPPLDSEGTAPRDRPRRQQASPHHRDVDQPPERTVVYTHGDWTAHTGAGRWAWVVPDRHYRSGFEARTTNPRMDLTAALDAVQELEGALEVISDSTYLVNCFGRRWWKGWLKRDWVNSKNKPVANRDIWEPLIESYRARPITFRLAGPEDDEWTRVARWLTAEASRTERGAEGEVTPPESW